MGWKTLEKYMKNNRTTIYNNLGRNAQPVETGSGYVFSWDRELLLKKQDNNNNNQSSGTCVDPLDPDP